MFRRPKRHLINVLPHAPLRTNTGVRLSESPEHWGQIGRNRPNIGVRLVEIARTMGSDWSESPEHWGQIGRNRPNIGVRLVEIARTLGAPMFVAFRPRRNRPNIGIRLVGIARTLGSDWAKSPEHWGADGLKSPEGLNIYDREGLGFRV